MTIVHHSDTLWQRFLCQYGIRPLLSLPLEAVTFLTGRALLLLSKNIRNG